MTEQPNGYECIHVFWFTYNLWDLGACYICLICDEYAKWVDYR